MGSATLSLLTSAGCIPLAFTGPIGWGIAILGGIGWGMFMANSSDKVKNSINSLD